MSLDLPPLTSDLIEVYERFRLKTCINFAAVAILAYDYFLTIGSEIELIWPSKFSYVKMLYLLTRYVVFCDAVTTLHYTVTPNLSISTCNWVSILNGWLIIFGVGVAELILLFRTWAIWGQGRRFGYSLGLFFIVFTTPIIVIEAVFVDSFRYVTYPSPFPPGCLLTGGKSVLGVGYVLISLAETVVLVLTFIKAFQHYKLGGVHGLLAVVFRDGILFCVFLFAASLVNVSVIFGGPHDLENMFTSLQRILHSTLTSRIVLNMREAHIRDMQATVTNASTFVVASVNGNVSSVEFSDELDI